MMSSTSELAAINGTIVLNVLFPEFLWKAAVVSGFLSTRGASLILIVFATLAA